MHNDQDKFSRMYGKTYVMASTAKSPLSNPNPEHGSLDLAYKGLTFQIAERVVAFSDLDRDTPSFHSIFKES